ncbi:MAG: DNA topoisomerase IV subunit A [Lentisphaerae bacterium]|nr:DNA topoisomerase IV subunit A [Lentisphaerota bacterium]
MKTEQPTLFDGLDAGGAPAPAAEPDAADDADAPAADDATGDIPGGSTPPPATGGGGGLHQEDDPLRRLFDFNFLQYASYVIRDRAIPDLQDGLKPVQRRILHSLFENDDGKFIKVANIVGHSMQYHPHGDVSIADALVGLANKGFLIERQGNFGNLYTGDPAAASRYIECRLTELARKEVFNPELTPMVPSYDGRRQEPVSLPSKLPLLLMQGAEGIAVGLSTRILPHNFGELVAAQIAILTKKPFKLYPDFRQGGLMEVSEYDKGNGRVRVRAVIEPRGEHTLVIRQIPFGTTTDTLIASIELAARKKQVHVKSIDDFTAELVEIEVHLAEDQKLDRAIQALFAFTQCEVAVAGRVVVIDDKRPVELDVHEVLQRNTKSLVDILHRELKGERARLLDEIHRLTLVQLFVEHRVYKSIETCDTYPKVKQAVFDGMNQFRDQLRRDLTHADVDMLLAIPIRRISLFDLAKNKKEIDDLVRELAEVEKNLGRLTDYAIRYLKNLLKTYGPEHPRLTQITSFEAVEVRDLTAHELQVRYDRQNGYLGHSITGDDLFACSSLDRIVIVWADGRYKVIPPPDKLFVDQNVIYCAVANRDKVMTLVYAHESITYLKRFTFGGAIMNKEYSCTQPGAKVLFFDADDPAELYVSYAPEKNQRIHQQVFDPRDATVKSAKTRGVRMTYKTISKISTAKPRNWEAKAGPKGCLMKF